MNDKQRLNELEAVLAQFLNPIKNLPFHLIIKSIAGHEILPIQKAEPNDVLLIEQLSHVALRTAELVRDNPIRRNRPNEVGNDIEPIVMDAANQLGFVAKRPKTASGKAKSTGYPDLLLRGGDGRFTYVECKIFGECGDLTTMRSFYLSPSDDFKVTMNARHLLMAFGVEREPIAGSRDSFYRAVSFKLVDLFSLKCDVKYEFNSDNQRLYNGDHMLAQGKI